VTESFPAHSRQKKRPQSVSDGALLLLSTCYNIFMWRRRLLIVGMMFLFATPVLVSAAGLTQIVPTDCTGNGGCQSICDIAQLAQNVLNDGIYVAVFLSAALFAWAGWRHMSAGGDAGQIKEANKVFSSVFIGLVLILSAWLIVSTLMSVLTGSGATPTLPWNQICSGGSSGGAGASGSI
jgi:hypothetical protein